MDNVGLNYILGLKDNFSGGMKAAHGIASGFEETIGHLKNELLGMFGAYELISFGKESVKAFEKIEHAKTQLDNALQNRSVGFSLKELTEQAEDYSHKWIFSKEQIMSAQLALTNFKNLQGQTFKQAEELAVNIASKKGLPLQDVINAVGRGLSDPEHAARLLRPMGVAFTDAQNKMLKSLVETGHVAKAQQVIFEALNSTYKGSADAAAQTAEGMKAIAGHGFEEFKEKIGGIIDEVEISLWKEYGDQIMGTLNNLSGWLTDHKEDIAAFFGHAANTVKFFASTIGDATGMLKAMFDETFGDKKFDWSWDKEGIHWDDVQDRIKKRYNPATGRMEDPAKSFDVDSWYAGLSDKLKGKKTETKTTASAGDGLGSGLTESKTSGAIKNITINVNQPFQNQKIMPASFQEGVNDISKAFIEFLNSLVMDASIVSSEG
jgi:hypothetical protein